jgi:hypothetical protein
VGGSDPIEGTLLISAVEDLIEEIIGEEIVSCHPSSSGEFKLIPRSTRRIEYRIISPRRQSSDLQQPPSCVSRAI